MKTKYKKGYKCKNCGKIYTKNNLPINCDVCGSNLKLKYTRYIHKVPSFDDVGEYKVNIKEGYNYRKTILTDNVIETTIKKDGLFKKWREN